MGKEIVAWQGYGEETMQAVLDVLEDAEIVIFGINGTDDYDQSKNQTPGLYTITVLVQDEVERGRVKQVLTSAGFSFGPLPKA